MIPVFVILIFAVVLILIGHAEGKKVKMNKLGGLDDGQSEKKSN